MQSKNKDLILTRETIELKDKTYTWGRLDMQCTWLLWTQHPEHEEYIKALKQDNSMKNAQRR